MKEIVNNQGQTIQVTNETFQQLQNCFADGVWCAFCYDAAQKIHSIILPDNF